MAEISWDFPDPFLLPMTVGPEHLDVMQHTNNVIYLGWLERVAWAHSEALGLGWTQYEALGHSMVARRHELDYLAPTFLGEQLLLATWIIWNDRLSTRRAYQFLRERDGKTVFRGRSQWVCVDIKEQRVRRMPPEFLAAYTSPHMIEE